MCFNKESSLTSYIVASVCSILLFYKGSKYEKQIAIFSFVFGQIQLAEYFMWVDQKCTKINHYASIFASLMLLLQPISLIATSYIYDTLIIPKIYYYITRLLHYFATLLL